MEDIVYPYYWTILLVNFNSHCLYNSLAQKPSLWTGSAAGKTKRNGWRREEKNGGACWHTIEVAISPLWTNLSLICQWLIISSTWMHWNVNRSHLKITARAKIRTFLRLLWMKWNGGKKRWRAYTTPTFVTYARLPFFYALSSDLFYF